MISDNISSAISGARQDYRKAEKRNQFYVIKLFIFKTLFVKQHFFYPLCHFVTMQQKKVGSRLWAEKCVGKNEMSSWKLISNRSVAWTIFRRIFFQKQESFRKEKINFRPKSAHALKKYHEFNFKGKRKKSRIKLPSLSLTVSLLYSHSKCQSIERFLNRRSTMKVEEVNTMNTMA